MMYFRPISISLALAYLLLLAGCAHYEPIPPTYTDGGPPWSDQQRRLSRSAFVYAMLSNNVYRDPNESFHLPASLGVRQAIEPPETYGHGYEYQVYERWRGDKLVEVIVSFRGTDFFELADWTYGNIGTLQRFFALETFRKVDRKSVV